MDKFSDYPTNLTAPAREAVAVTPSDSSDLPVLPRAIYVGQAGNLAVRMPDGSAVIFANVQSGSFLPIRVQGINATGTTASAIVTLW